MRTTTSSCPRSSHGVWPGEGRSGHLCLQPTQPPAHHPYLLSGSLHCLLPSRGFPLSPKRPTCLLLMPEAQPTSVACVLLVTVQILRNGQVGGQPAHRSL